MASSGTINGNQSGTQPYLRISWTTLSQEISNNRSRVRLDLILVSPYSLFFNANKTGSNNGSSFTYTGGFSGTGTRLVNRREIWVNHNSDGTRTQSVNGSFNIAVNWGGSHLSSISVSGNMNLDTIPRASTLNSFSIGSHLRPSTSNTVNLSISRASGSFTHDIQLRDGSTVLQSWNGQGLPSSLSISSGTVNTLLSRMSSVNSRSLTLRVQTKSGSSNIGSAVTRTATATVHSNVTPNATGLSVWINGSGRDSTISRYVQSVSRASASFTGTATGGASVSSRRIIIRNTNGSNSTTINSGSGTSSVLTGSGSYEAIATVTDSRGRTASQTVPFTVTAYSEPRITNFSPVRNNSTPTTVNITRSGNHSPISGSLNTLTILVQRRQGTGSWTTVQSTSTTSSTFSGSSTSTGNSVTQSYEFRILVTDTFGNSAEAFGTVSTQQVVLDIHKDEGVGIGKIHEQGTLDVQGETYLGGDVTIGNIIDESRLDINRGGNSLRFITPHTNGYAFMSWHGPDMTRTAYFGIPGVNASNIVLENTQGGGINLRGSELLFNNDDIVASGETSEGTWIRFADGTQICHYLDSETMNTTSNNNGVYWSAKIFDYPRAFIDRPSVSVTDRRISGGVLWSGNRLQWHDRIDCYLMSSSTGGTGRLGYIAIGRWKS